MPETTAFFHYKLRPRTYTGEKYGLALTLTVILYILVMRLLSHYDAPVLASTGMAVVAGYCFVTVGAGVKLWKHFRG